MTKNQKKEDVVTTEIKALFVQTSSYASYEDGKLMMGGVTPTTLVFSDRPERVVGHIPIREFIESWDQGENNFADVPPNAVLSMFTETHVIDVVVILSNPILEGDMLTFDVDILDGEMPAEAGPNSLFVDVIGRPASATSVAGVRRRSRRRARR